MKLFTLSLAKHKLFLSLVIVHSVTAFGGPQMHLIRLHKLFVEKGKFLTEDELIELNAFVQLLPGASSSQLVTLIGFRLGGSLLAVITLLIWVFPAAVMMSLLTFLLRLTDVAGLQTRMFELIQPMAIGFLAFSAFRSYKLFIRHEATVIIMLGSLLITLFIQSPWVFPSLLILGSIISNFSSKRIPEKEGEKLPIQWSNLWLFILIFIAAGILSESARLNNWAFRRPINLFENFYRFGSLVFGGGGVLIPMMFEQYVIRAKTKYVSASDFLIGAGMVQALPGPVFSIASFVGALVLQQMGWKYQLLGSFIGTVAIFLPSLLLVIFFYPIWNRLKKYVVVFRSMEGINAVVVGIMTAATVLLFDAIPHNGNLVNIAAVVVTFLLLQFTRLPSPVVVLLFILLGLVL